MMPPPALASLKLPSTAFSCPMQLHLKFCYEAVAKHAEQILLQHGVSVATYSRNAASTVSKVTTIKH